MEYVELNEASRLAGVSIRAVQRAVQAGRVKIRKSRPNQRGKPTPLFAVADLERLTAKREWIPTWKRFDRACRLHGANPAHVLCQFLQNSQFDSFDGQRADLDLFHAGIRRTLESDGAFVGMVLGRVQPQSDFDRQLAAVLGGEPLNMARWRQAAAMSFRELWRHLRRQATKVFGHNVTATLRTEWREQPTHSFDRSHVTNTMRQSVSRLAFRPRYLNDIRGSSKPTWAFDSIVRTDRQTRTFYATAERDLGEAIWQWQDGKPTAQHTADFLYAMASARCGDADEAVKMLVGLGVKRVSAKAFAEAWQQAGQASRKTFDRATVNRIFCQSRAAAL